MQEQMTTSLLQHYLTTVDEVSTQKPKSKQARKKRNELESDMTKHYVQAIRADVLSTVAYASSYQQCIKEEYKQLSEVQHTIVNQLLQHSYGQPVSYSTIISELSHRLEMCTFAVKQELAYLLKKRIVLGYTHTWRGQYIRVAPMWRQYYLQLKMYHLHDSQPIKQPYLPDYRLVDTRYTRPLEKQVVFIMFQLKSMSLQLNQANKLHKSVLSELRTKILAINPLLCILDEPTFHVQLDNYFIPFDEHLYECEDAVVRFILQLACMLHFVEKKEDGFKWNEQNWLSWLQLEEYARHDMLKLLVTDMVTQRTEAPNGYLFMNVLAISENWIQFQINQANQEDASRVIQLAYACGWIEAVYKQNLYFIRKVPKLLTCSEPQLLSSFQLLCFPDCSSEALWEIMHVAKIEQNQQLLIFQVDAQSIHKAGHYRYSLNKIEAILKLNRHQQWLQQWQRLCQLAEKLSASHSQPLNKAQSSGIVNVIEQDEQGSSPWHSSCLAYAVGVSLPIESNVIEQELQNTKALLNKYPEQWFTKLKIYNISTIKEMVELAQAYGLELEVMLGAKLYRVIATMSCESNNDVIITLKYMDNRQASDKIKRFHIEQFSLNMVRLISAY